MIRLQANLKLKTKQSVRILNKCWDRPTYGTLHKGTTIQVSGGPTRLSDVSFTVLKGRGVMNNEVVSEGDSYFFNQGHDTVAPYDYGTLDPTLYEIVK